MAVIFQIGLVTLLMIVVSGQWEYTINKVNNLPHIRWYSILTDNLLEHKLINPGAKVKWNRDNKLTDPTVLFVVDTKWKDESSELSPSSETAESCKGRPGIELKYQCKKRLHSLCCAEPNDLPRLFCLKRMNIDFIADSYKPKAGPYIQVEAKFYDSEKNKISIKLDMLKPPTQKADKEHAENNKIPHIDSPIPEESLEKFDNQHFIGDILWMNEALARVLFMKSNKEGLIKKNCVEHYSTGPVLLNNEPYRKILDLRRFCQPDVLY